MIASRLTHRATIERNTATGTDTWGQPVAPVFTALGVLPCFAWSRVSREITDGDKTGLVEDLRALFALSSDIREGDEIASITDRAGRVIIPGRLRIEGPVQHKHTHKEAALRRIGEGG